MMVTVPAVPLMPTVVVAVVIGLVVITAIVAGIPRIVTVLVVARFYVYTNASFRFRRDQSEQSYGLILPGSPDFPTRRRPVAHFGAKFAYVRERCLAVLMYKNNS